MIRFTGVSIDEAIHLSTTTDEDAETDEEDKDDSIHETTHLFITTDEDTETDEEVKCVQQCVSCVACVFNDLFIVYRNKNDVAIQRSREKKMLKDFKRSVSRSPNISWIREIAKSCGSPPEMR